MSLTWVSANGSTWPLDGSLGVTMVGKDDGVFSAPFDLIVDQRVGADGAVILNRRRSPQQLGFELLVVDPVRVLAVWPAMYAALYAGGTLQYGGPSGVRELRQVELTGVDQSLIGQDLQFRIDDVIPVSLLALDPWWYGPAVQQSISFGVPTGWDAPIAWDAAIPWNGGAAVTITVAGNAPAHPLWTITGAVTELIVGNGVQAWTWTEDLTAGSYGTVDHRPGSKGPRLGSNLNGVAESGFALFFLLSNDHSLEWGLAKGANELIVSVAGNGAGSMLGLWYEPRWLSPG